MTTFKRLATVGGVLLFGTCAIGGNQAKADQVFADDVIVQGSLCAGLDCVNNMNFGFDTVVLQENNTRLFFNDTSTSSGFPANDWRLIANDSASGGANYFVIEDSTAGRQVFRVDAGARTNSIYVSSAGRVGFGTSTPVLTLHALTGDTPGLRLQQDGSSGFSPYIWDVAGNEANFFVRDLTAGSTLPFRIFPGAPTSSLIVSGAGNVGVGTTSPGLVSAAGRRYVTVQGSSDAGIVEFSTGASDGPNLVGALQFTDKNSTSTEKRVAIIAGENSTATANNRGGVIRFFTKQDNTATISERVRITDTGNVGIGTSTPAAQLNTTGSVRFAGVANCSSGIQSNASGDLSCITSSRLFKTVAGDLKPNLALANVMALRPQVGAYKSTPDVPEHWLIAEDVAAVDPALAGFKDGKPYTVKTQNVVADLVAVVQRQQQQIDRLERALADGNK